MYCMNCGAAMPDTEKFCPRCGIPQEPMVRTAPAPDPGPTFQQQTSRQIKLPTVQSGPYMIRFDKQGGEKDLIEQVNLWLASNPTCGNIRCCFDTGSSYGMLTNHTTLTNATLEYSVLSGTNPYCYKLEDVVWFGLYAKPAGKVLEDWKQQRPGAVVLNTSSSAYSRGRSESLMFGGIGARNETAIYVFYKQPRTTMGRA